MRECVWKWESGCERERRPACLAVNMYCLERKETLNLSLS